MGFSSGSHGRYISDGFRMIGAKMFMLFVAVIGLNFVRPIRGWTTPSRVASTDATPTFSAQPLIRVPLETRPLTEKFSPTFVSISTPGPR